MSEAPDHDVLAMARRVADNVRAERLARGLTLDELAKRTGVSRATLSQIETCGTNPTLAVLWRVAAGLDVPFSKLLGEQTEEPRIQHIDIAKQDVIRSADGRVESRPVSVGGAGVDIYEVTLQPGTVYEAAGHGVGTREIAVVSAGRLRVRTEGALHEAGPRQALVFTADQPHAYESLGQRATRFLNVILSSTR